MLKSLGSAIPSLKLSWRSSALMAAAGCSTFPEILRGFAHKATTGIVGLPVDEEARSNLTAILNQVLEEIKIIPADVEYRKAVEETVNRKLSALATDVSDEDLEASFGRQLEQEIKLCQEELKLIPRMAEWKPWDVPAGHTVRFPFAFIVY